LNAPPGGADGGSPENCLSFPHSAAADWSSWAVYQSEQGRQLRLIRDVHIQFIQRPMATAKKKNTPAAAGAGGKSFSIM